MKKITITIFRLLPLFASSLSILAVVGLGLNVIKNIFPNDDKPDSTQVITSTIDTVLIQYADYIAASSTMYRIEEDLINLKNLLFDDPEAVLTIPLLKKDIDNLENDIKNIREELKTVRNMAKWYLGIMITLSIGLFATVITVNRKTTTGDASINKRGSLKNENNTK